MTKLNELTTSCQPNWCPGCGNLAIWAAFKNAAVTNDWNNNNTVIVAGIGCHGHIVNFTKLNSFEGLHGRALPVASGIKMANHRLNVFVFTGDGDSLAEGGNHFIHASRRNHDMTIILHDNGLYALTTGQTSPASEHGFKSKSTPEGNHDYPLNPLAMAIAAGATFVAREYAVNIQKLADLITQANAHKGLAIVDVLQPCPTFNHEHNHKFYQDNTYYLPDDYDPTNKEKAFAKALEFGLKTIPLGIIYKEEKLPYESQLPQLSVKPLVEQEVNLSNLKGLFSTYI